MNFNSFLSRVVGALNSAYSWTEKILGKCNFCVLSAAVVAFNAVFALCSTISRAKRDKKRFDMSLPATFFFACAAVALAGTVDFFGGTEFDSIIEPIAVAICDYAALIALYGVFLLVCRGEVELCSVEIAAARDDSFMPNFNRVRARPTGRGDLRGGFTESQISVRRGFEAADTDPPVSFSFVISCLSRLSAYPLTEKERDEVESAKTRVRMMTGSALSSNAKRVLSDAFMTAVKIDAKYGDRN